VTFAIDNINGALPDRRQANRIAAGIAVSVLAHVLLLALYRQPATTLPEAPPERLTIRLKAAPPPPPVEVKPAETPPEPLPRAQPPARKTRPVIAVPVEKRQSTEETYAVKPAPETPTPPPAPATTTQHFDLDAARSMARGMATKLANEPDPDKVGTALERLPKPALQTESKFERAIKQAKRPDCKDGVPGGLLAPIFLAMDKKDSGCKW
jgi:hypothetical protein